MTPARRSVAITSPPILPLIIQSHVYLWSCVDHPCPRPSDSLHLSLCPFALMYHPQIFTNNEETILIFLLSCSVALMTCVSTQQWMQWCCCRRILVQLPRLLLRIIPYGSRTTKTHISAPMRLDHAARILGCTVQRNGGPVGSDQRE